MRRRLWIRWARVDMDVMRSLAPRDGWYPVVAHAVAVCAALRLRCDARSEVAPHNSLRSLRSLRSDKCGESVYEARAARAPTSALGFSPPQKSPPPGTTHRAETMAVRFDEHLGASGKAVGGYASAATYAAPRSAGLMAARASAHRVLTRRDCSSGESAANAASFATGREREHRREPVAKRRAAASERRRMPARGFASAQCWPSLRRSTQ
jgi:hypothetical protein